METTFCLPACRIIPIATAHYQVTAALPGPWCPPHPLPPGWPLPPVYPAQFLHLSPALTDSWGDYHNQHAFYEFQITRSVTRRRMRASAAVAKHCALSMAVCPCLTGGCQSARTFPQLATLTWRLRGFRKNGTGVCPEMTFCYSFGLAVRMAFIERLSMTY